MELLRAELALVLGEKISRLVPVSEQPNATLFALYDKSGHAMSLVAKCYRNSGMAAQEAYKLSMLAREGAVRLPTVYGVVLSQQKPQHEVLLIERMGGVSAEAPTRTPQRWAELQQQIVESMLAWHRIDSHGLVGSVDSTQENHWAAWYKQRVEVLWATLSNLTPPDLTPDDRRILYRSREQLPQLFHDFDDNCVLVHGNLTLRNMLKDARSDQLLAMINPGTMLWAPREYELFRLATGGAAESLLYRYLEHAPVAEAFIGRRWLYQLWEAVATMVDSGKFDRTQFSTASAGLLPWLY
ncbi:fructosamine-3-kinase [Erwinia toletana]|uniref:Fructosamine-3-kinase n=1 Tax=Winslowiella toletana TaxID=92490 RepID=A0ABS4PEU9_9GAMM|nr:YcbJ family phosphotransferase [Winslowiella toletana]MBP2170621.1 fructosamine-3-kinase [Winslowiella toletana]